MKSNVTRQNNSSMECFHTKMNYRQIINFNDPHAQFEFELNKSLGKTIYYYKKCTKNNNEKFFVNTFR